MDFNQRKLSREVTEKMRTCPIRTVKPFALMMGPVYVYLKLNEKYVMVKAAFDFFTEEELKRLKAFEVFYFPEEVETALQFRKVASEVRAILRWRPEPTVSARSYRQENSLPPASFEVSDAVMRQLSTLWKPGPEIDPFFVAVFSNELCDPLPVELLKGFRDRDIVLYEKALLTASWVVFLALHLGYSDLDFLNRLRLQVFQEVNSAPVSHPIASKEVRELIHAARESLGQRESSQPGNPMNATHLTGTFGRTSEKLSSRFKRLERLADV